GSLHPARPRRRLARRLRADRCRRRRGGAGWGPGRAPAGDRQPRAAPRRGRCLPRGRGEDDGLPHRHGRLRGGERGLRRRLRRPPPGPVGGGGCGPPPRRRRRDRGVGVGGRCRCARGRL
ncbi:MAG: RidA/YER057c/UK114 superfamily protein, partial [uncultured Acidimicrobiales bacterium]